MAVTVVALRSVIFLSILQFITPPYHYSIFTMTLLLPEETIYLVAVANLDSFNSETVKQKLLFHFIFTLLYLLTDYYSYVKIAPVSTLQNYNSNKKWVIVLLTIYCSCKYGYKYITPLLWVFLLLVKLFGFTYGLVFCYRSICGLSWVPWKQVPFV